MTCLLSDICSGLRSPERAALQVTWAPATRALGQAGVTESRLGALQGLPGPHRIAQLHRALTDERAAATALLWKNGVRCPKGREVAQQTTSKPLAQRRDDAADRRRVVTDGGPVVL
jgi:hypothetical protein